MILGIVAAVVLVLFVIAILPPRKREAVRDLVPRESILPASLVPAQTPAERSLTLREQQLQEEAAAVASEYQRRAEEVWLGELRAKAASLLESPKATT